MNKKIAALLLLVSLLSACGAQSAATPPPTATTAKIPPTVTVTVAPPTLPPPLPTVTPVCIPPAPTQDDLNRALAYTGQAFAASVWERSEEIGETGVSVVWRNEMSNAVVYLQALIFPCGYEEPELNAYFSEQNWQAIFAAYDGYQPVAECRVDSGLRLYQFTAQSLGTDFTVSYWVENDTDNRVIATMIVFPTEQSAEASAYAVQLFPKLPNCS